MTDVVRIGAHPDDVEFGMSGAVVRFARIFVVEPFFSAEPPVVSPVLGLV